MVFQQNDSGAPDKRLKSAAGSYIFSRQKELILDLLAPHAGERLLDVGCGTGSYLKLFKEKGCAVTGIDTAAAALDIAREKLGRNADLQLGEAEDLPFSDNEFDVVTMINVLELTHNPQKAIAEAIRVCRNRIFIGFVNKNSFVGTRRQMKEMFGFSLAADIRFFSVGELKNMAEKIIGAPAIKWGSVIYLPAVVYDFFTELEEVFPMAKNPFGAFAGVTFPIKYTYRTAENPLLESFKLGDKSAAAATEAVRGILNGAEK